MASFNIQLKRLAGLLFFVMAIHWQTFAQAGISYNFEMVLSDNSVIHTQADTFQIPHVYFLIRETALQNGVHFDVRVKNRGATDLEIKTVRIKLPRTGNSNVAVIDGITCSIPCEIRQYWSASALINAAVMHGFVYQVFSNGAEIKKVGPSEVYEEWGGRYNGIVRVDGEVIMIPEFWERQPRSIFVSNDSLILTFLNNHPEPFRAGEDIIDRFVILNDTGQTNDEILEISDHLPDLTENQRLALMQEYDITDDSLASGQSNIDSLLQKWDRWQGASWDLQYCDNMPGRWWPGQPEAPEKTTLFTLFAKGLYYPENNEGMYTWRDYGDINWGDGICSLHYDWVRAALKHYLRTGDKRALKWAYMAARHSISVDHVWESLAAGTQAAIGGTNYAGLARYEKGDHGTTGNRPLPTHTWAEGLFLANRIFNDEWFLDAAIDRAEGVWRFHNGNDTATWNGEYGETRMASWPILILIDAYKETQNEKYWTKAKELFHNIYDQEIRSGAGGYITNSSLYVGNLNNAQSLMTFYSLRALLPFADLAMAKGEWQDEYTQMMVRTGIWLSTPIPEGVYVPDGSYLNPPDDITFGRYAYFFLPPGLTGTYPTSSTSSGVEIPYTIMASDIYAWLSVHDPEGFNPVNNKTWRELCLLNFGDAVYHGAQGSGFVGFLTNYYPTSETKVIGWMQLFGDRAAGYLSNNQVSCFVQHQITIPPGWNSLSSYVMPTETDIEALLSGIFPELVTLQTMTDVYFPAGGINTIVNWESQSAYKIKVDEEVTLTIAGLLEQNKTITLAEGWNLIPVISDQPVEVTSLFSGVANDVIVIKSIADMGIYWPQFDINTLIHLQPGKAYFVKMINASEVTFP